MNRYVLWLWESLVVMMPFDLSIVDTGSGSESVVHQLYTRAQSCLSLSDKTRDAAALLLARSACVV